MIRHNYNNNQLRVMEVSAQIAWFRNWTMEPDFSHDEIARMRAEGLVNEIDMVDSCSTDLNLIEFKFKCDWQGCRQWLREYLGRFKG